LNLLSITTAGNETLGIEKEIVNDAEVRYFGWCYSVDGVTPADTLPDEYILTGSEKSIVWYYGYALRVRGKWTRQCIPAYAP
jgi:hypothetical protein